MRFFLGDWRIKATCVSDRFHVSNRNVMTDRLAVQEVLAQDLTAGKVKGSPTKTHSRWEELCTHGWSTQKNHHKLNRLFFGESGSKTSHNGGNSDWIWKRQHAWAAV